MTICINWLHMRGTEESYVLWKAGAADRLPSGMTRAGNAIFGLAANVAQRM
jgi:hypothetical protein